MSRSSPGTKQQRRVLGSGATRDLLGAGWGQWVRDGDGGCGMGTPRTPRTRGQGCPGLCSHTSQGFKPPCWVFPLFERFFGSFHTFPLTLDFPGDFSHRKANKEIWGGQQRWDLAPCHLPGIFPFSILLPAASGASGDNSGPPAPTRGVPFPVPHRAGGRESPRRAA